MNRDQARTLIAQTFTQSFDKPRFGSFVVNVLNRIDESKAGAWNSQYIKDAFKDHVQRYERLGTYTSPDERETRCFDCLSHDSVETGTRAHGHSKFRGRPPQERGTRKTPPSSRLCRLRRSNGDSLT